MTTPEDLQVAAEHYRAFLDAREESLKGMREGMTSAKQLLQEAIDGSAENPEMVLIGTTAGLTIALADHVYGVDERLIMLERAVLDLTQVIQDLQRSKFAQNLNTG